MEVEDTRMEAGEPARTPTAMRPVVVVVVVVASVSDSQNRNLSLETMIEFVASELRGCGSACCSFAAVGGDSTSIFLDSYARASIQQTEQHNSFHALERQQNTIQRRSCRKTL